MKDLDADLLRHLAQGTAFLQVSTKAHPRGEMRGWVGPPRCVPVAPPLGARQGPGLRGPAWGGLGRGQDGDSASSLAWRARGVPLGANPPAPQVHIPNRCQAGGARLAPGEAELSEGSKGRDAEQLKKDPNSCFFEGQHRAHGTRWAPDYDKKCSICSCQVRAGRV